MKYPKRVAALLGRAKADVGDEVQITVEAETYQGIVMPHHSFSEKDVLTIKLANGYNVGLRVTAETPLKRVAKGRERAVPQRTVPMNPDKPNVSFLGTGGTIASYVDYRTGAVYPALSAEELASYAPDLADICNVQARVLFSLLSEDMGGKNWRRLAQEAAKDLNGGAKAVVVPHGTDTLGYTAAALSFMLTDLTGPVVLVGSQRSSDRPSSDAFLNLMCAAHLSNANLGEVVAVMHEETSDLVCTVHRGTKVRKMHSSRRDAFRTLNEDPLGRVHRNGEVTWHNGHRPRAEGPVKVDNKMEERVALIHVYPDMPPDLFDAWAERSRGIVLAGTGLGHVRKPLVTRIRKAIRDGVSVVMTTQCLNGRVGLYVYSRGRELARAGVIPGEDMLPETALVKLMWVLGHTTEPSEVRGLMISDLAGEINPKLRLEESKPG